LWCPHPITHTTAGYSLSPQQCSTTGSSLLQGKNNPTVFQLFVGALQPPEMGDGCSEGRYCPPLWLQPCIIFPLIIPGHALTSSRWEITSAGWCWTTSLTPSTYWTLVFDFAQVTYLRLQLLEFICKKKNLNHGESWDSGSLCHFHTSDSIFANISNVTAVPSGIIPSSIKTLSTIYICESSSSKCVTSKHFQQAQLFLLKNRY